MKLVPEQPPDHANSPVVSVVVSKHSTSTNIAPFINDLQKALEGVATFEIIVVCCRSIIDPPIHSVGSHPSVRMIHLDGVQDPALAIIRGISEARGSIIVVLDDVPSRVSDVVHSLIKPILEDAQDIVVGSESVARGITQKVPFGQQLLRRFSAILAMPFVDVHDPFSRCFAARRHTFNALSPEYCGPHILLELLATQDESIRVHEIHAGYTNHERRTSTLSVDVKVNFLRQLARLSGAVASGGSAIRFGVVGLLGVGVDLSIYLLLLSIGFSVGTSHIASFFVATVFNYILNDIWSFKRHRSPKQSKVTIARYGAFLLVCLAALFIRGGVLATGIELGFSSTLSVVFAIAFATGVNFLGSVLFVFAQAEQVRLSIRLRLAAVAIVGYSFVLRIAYVGAIDLLPQEAYYWNYAKHLDIGYLDHPPMIAWLIGLSTFLLGDTEVAVRLPTFFCWFITLGFICALTNRIVGRSAAFAAGAVIAIFPFFFLSGFIATPDSPLMACWAGSMYYLHRAITDHKRSGWIGFGIAVGLGLLSKYTIALICPVALLLLLIDRDSRRWFWNPYPYISAVIALAIFSPVIVWNANHEWISFAFQSIRRLEQDTQFGIPLLVGSIMILLTPVGFFSAMRAIAVSSRDHCHVSKLNRRFIFVSVIVPLGVFVIYSLQNDPKLNWTGPLWLTLVPLMVLDFVQPRHRIPCLTRIPTVPMGWKLTFIGALFLFGGGFHYFALGIPGLGYLKGMQAPVAWEELGRAIDALKDEVEPDLNGVPFVVGMDQYFLASELAFYRKKDVLEANNLEERLAYTTTRHLFQHIGLMYELWTPVESVVGSDCILVGFIPDDIADFRTKHYFSSMTEIKQITITKNNSVVHTFVWRIGIQYHAIP